MKFDIVFLDSATPSYYDLTTLESGNLGGTESSVIRLAEGLASLGLSVGVFLHIGGVDFEPIAGDHCVFLPWSMLKDVERNPGAVIHLRSVANLHLFPNANQFVWLHDLPHDKMTTWPETVKDYQVTFIAVSKWHQEAIRSLEPRLKTIQLYSPVDEKCYTLQRPEVNKNSLIWNASPHKGLSEALPVLKKLREKLPQVSLYVMNPGYIKTQRLAAEGVMTLGSVSRPVLRQIVASSLCLFYPSQFQETFGLIAAEANAMGVPVACYKLAALAESVSEENGWCKDDDEMVLRIKEWYTKRPTEITGQQRFRLRTVLPQWIKALSS